VSFALGTTLPACVLPLDDEFDEDASDADMPPAEDATAPNIASGCLPFSADRGRTLTGDLRSIGLPDGGALFVADQGALGDGGVGPAAFVVSQWPSSSCSAWMGGPARAAFGASPLAPDGLLVPLDLVATPTALALYYALLVPDITQPLGLRAMGNGIAFQEAPGGPFVPTAELLWSPDRPSFGTSVLVLATTAYVYGCRSDGPFSARCFVSRAPVADLASAAAYSYWDGQGWSQNVDDAAPVAEAGTSVSVRADPSGAPRFLMTYVPPLGGTLVARGASAPEGPWSAPVTLAACDLTGTGAGAFCAGGQQHAELSSAGRLVLTYDARTFAPDAGASAAFWPRLVTLDVPASFAAAPPSH
jgi:hypothetical protein